MHLLVVMKQVNTSNVSVVPYLMKSRTLLIAVLVQTMTNPYESSHIAHGREEAAAIKGEQDLATAVDAYSCLPLREDHYEAVEDFLSSLDCNDIQHAALVKLIITVALNGPVDYKDVEDILTLDDVKRVIEKELTK